MNKIKELELPPLNIRQIAGRGGDMTRWEWGDKLNELTKAVNFLLEEHEKTKQQ